MLTIVPDPVSGDDQPVAAGSSLIDEIVREGACRMLTEAVRPEVDAYIAAFADERGPDGRRLVVRNGYHQPREVLTSAGAVQVTAPRVNDKRTVEPACENVWAGQHAEKVQIGQKDQGVWEGAVVVSEQSVGVGHPRGCPTAEPVGRVAQQPEVGGSRLVQRHLANNVSVVEDIDLRTAQLAGEVEPILKIPQRGDRTFGRR